MVYTPLQKVYTPFMMALRNGVESYTPMDFQHIR